MRCCELGDGEDDELGGTEGSEADLDVDAVVVDVGLSRRGGIAFYEEGLLRVTTLQGALLPEVGEERRDRETDGGPEGRTVGFEDDPWKAGVEALLEVDEETADVDVLELESLVVCACGGASSPYDGAVGGKAADGVDGE